MRVFLGVKTTSGTVAAPCLEIIAGPNKAVQLLKVSIDLASAVASEFGLGFPQAKGVGPTSPVEMLGPLAGAQLQLAIPKTALAWGTTAPTVPTRFHARGSFAGTVGERVVWQFDDDKTERPNGILIPANGSIVLWNITANGVFNVSLTADVM